MDAATIFSVGLGGLGLLISFFAFAFFAVMIFGIIFWLMMLIDVYKREFPNPNDKTVWVLIVVFAGILGSLVYYLVIKSKAVGKVKKK